MTTVKVSPKYQVVIPKSVRKGLGIKPGDKVEVLEYENRIEYILVKEPKPCAGMRRGSTRPSVQVRSKNWFDS